MLPLTGCTSPPTPSSPSAASSPTTASTTGSPATPKPLRPPATIDPDDPDAWLSQVRVTRRGEVVRFHALWVAGEGDRDHRALVVGNGAERRHLARPNDAVLRQAFPTPSPTPPAEAAAVLGRLMLFPVPSLDPSTRAVIGGGDGATLLPFQRVARSEEYDDWFVQPLPRIDGEMAYVSGAVALGDGRLVALLDHFSDDRAGRPSDRHHGLWASHGRDWSAYSPLGARFEPPLPRVPDGWGPIVSLGATAAPDPIVWVTTWDHRLYVSSDQMRTFHELDARGAGAGS